MFEKEVKRLLILFAAVVATICFVINGIIGFVIYFTL